MTEPKKNKVDISDIKNDIDGNTEDITETKQATI